jgi:hypothetical protein
LLTLMHFRVFVQLSRGVKIRRGIYQPPYHSHILQEVDMRIAVSNMWNAIFSFFLIYDIHLSGQLGSQWTFYYTESQTNIWSLQRYLSLSRCGFCALKCLSIVSLVLKQHASRFMLIFINVHVLKSTIMWCEQRK